MGLPPDQTAEHARNAKTETVESTRAISEAMILAWERAEKGRTHGSHTPSLLLGWHSSCFKANLIHCGRLESEQEVERGAQSAAR